MKKVLEESETLHGFLLKFRSTSLLNGMTPAELLFGQNILSKLDFI